MFAWSSISANDANPKKIKPKGMNLWFLKFLNLLTELSPMTIGIITACKWTKNKIKKNKLISKLRLL